MSSTVKKFSLMHFVGFIYSTVTIKDVLKFHVYVRGSLREQTFIRTDALSQDSMCNAATRTPPA